MSEHAIDWTLGADNHQRGTEIHPAHWLHNYFIVAPKGWHEVAPVTNITSGMRFCNSYYHPWNPVELRMVGYAASYFANTMESSVGGCVFIAPDEVVEFVGEATGATYDDWGRRSNG